MDADKKNELVSWLAESHLSHCLAPQLATPPLKKELVKLIGGKTLAELNWAERLGHIEYKLDYEPRALAVDRTARHVAVGTKSGTIFLASQASKSNWSVLALSTNDDGHAVRGLAFLDGNTLLASVGFGKVVCRHDIGSRSLRDRPDEWQVVDTHAEHDFDLRCTTIVPLPGGRARKSLVLTGSPRTYIFSETAPGRSELTLIEASRLLPQWDDNERIVDARIDRSASVLMVLGNGGTLALYSWRANGATGKLRQRLRIVPPRKYARPAGQGHQDYVFRALSRWPGGLAVLASDHVTCIPYKFTNRGLPQFEDVEELDARWIRVPHADALTAWQPYRDGKRVAVFVGSATQGVSFLMWRIDGHPLDVVPRPVELPVIRKPRGVLFVTARSEEHDLDRPALLAVATRDHRLIITSILDRKFVRDALSKQVPLLPSAYRSRRGVAFFRAQSGINAFQGRAATGDQPRLVEDEYDFSTFEAADLIRLGPATVSALAKGRTTNADPPIEWLLKILQRAQQLDPDARADVYFVIGEALEAAAGKGDATPLVRGVWRLYRKWVVYGETYAAKQTELGWLAFSNRHRPLDALQYRTKLLRRRVDPIWRLEIGPPDVKPSPTLAIATAEIGVQPDDGPARGQTLVVVQALTDGSIAGSLVTLSSQSVESDEAHFPERHVLRGSSRHVKFQPANDRIAAALRDHGLAITASGALERRDAQDFRDKYQYGPYARRVLIESTDVADRLLLLFAVHGWRSADFDDEVATEKGPRFYALRVSPSDRSHGSLTIHSIHSAPLHDELYAIEKVSPNDAWPIELLAGCGGLRRMDRDYVPFLRISVPLADHSLTLTPVKASQQAADAAVERFSQEALVDAVRNPCRGIVVREQAGSLSIWAGFHSGEICEYTIGSRSATRERLLIQAKSAIRYMAGYSREGRAFVAYATAGGTIAVIDVENSKRIPVHLVHTLEQDSSICFLGFLTAEKRARLLAITQQGMASIHDVDSLLLEQVDPASRRVDEATFRIRIPGFRIERFSLRVEPRAATTRMSAQTGRALIILGAADGTITGGDFILPRGTKRRWDAAHGCRQIWDKYEDDSHARRDGPARKELLRWLRVFSVGKDVEDVHLLRFSMWKELSERVETAFQFSRPSPFSAIQETLDGLRQEAFSRKPFSHEPAKMLWEEIGRFAQLSTRAALVRGDEAGWAPAFDAHKAVNDMCNRWIGQKRTIEAAVLSHSFKYLFDWEDVELLCSTLVYATAVDLQRLLLVAIVQRRLTHGSRFVPLEALETINAAIVRSIAYRLFEGAQERIEFRESGLYRLAILVGEFAKRRSGALVPSDTLFTHIARFFGAVLLRAPDHTLLTFQILSENRLIKASGSLAEAAHIYAIRLSNSFRNVQPSPAHINAFSDRWITGLDLFKAACDGLETDKNWETIRTHQAAHRRTNALDNDAVVDEMVAVYYAAEDLARIRRPVTNDGQAVDGDLYDQTRAWLDGEPVSFYEDTRQYFKDLATQNRARLVEFLKPGRRVMKALATTAMAICDEESELLSQSTLFQPQVRQYQAQIIECWRREFEEQALRASSLLQVVNRFNRHVYRAQADALMAAVTDLALQTSPRWLPMLNGEALSSFHLQTKRALAEHDRVEAVYDGVTRLVDESYLVGALLATANAAQENDGASPRTTAKEFLELLEREGRHVDITFDHEKAPDAAYLPGSWGVWTAVAGELCRNLVRYGFEERATSGQRTARCVVNRESVSVYGEHPFSAQLTKKERIDYLDKGSDMEKAAFLDEHARARVVPGQPRPEHESEFFRGGYGLAMVDLICQFLGVNFECKVFPTLGDPDNWPFVSEISWMSDDAART